METTVPALHRRSQAALAGGIALVWVSGAIVGWSVSISLLVALAGLPLIFGSLIMAEANVLQLAREKVCG